MEGREGWLAASVTLQGGCPSAIPATVLAQALSGRADMIPTCGWPSPHLLRLHTGLLLHALSWALLAAG
jgi:hypothetical protein